MARARGVRASELTASATVAKTVYAERCDHQRGMAQECRDRDAGVGGRRCDGWRLLRLHSIPGCNSPNAGVVPFLIAYIAAVALIAALSVWLILSEHRTIAKTMLVAAAAGCGALGILAIFSIGLGLLITAGLLAMAALGVAPQASRLPQLAGALGAIGVLVAGFTLTGVFWGS